MTLSETLVLYGTLPAQTSEGDPGEQGKKGWGGPILLEREPLMFCKYV